MARRGASEVSDVAIDDFSVRPGKCEGQWVVNYNITSNICTASKY